MGNHRSSRHPQGYDCFVDLVLEPHTGSTVNDLVIGYVLKYSLMVLEIGICVVKQVDYVRDLILVQLLVDSWNSMKKIFVT